MCDIFVCDFSMIYAYIYHQSHQNELCTVLSCIMYGS